MRMVARLLWPCFSAFIAQRALPALVLGPVERCHGCQRRIRTAWSARRSGDQPFLYNRLVTLDDSPFQLSVCSKILHTLEVLDSSNDLAKQGEMEGLHG